MNRFTLIAASALVILSSCGAKKEQDKATIAPAPAAEPTQTASPFKPNENGTATFHQVKFWVAANPLLDSVSAAYAEKLSTKDSAAYKISIDEYTASRETVCKTAGLSGGYQEYFWISQNISNEVNRSVRDSLKLKSM